MPQPSRKPYKVIRKKSPQPAWRALYSTYHGERWLTVHAKTKGLAEQLAKLRCPYRFGWTFVRVEEQPRLEQNNA